MSASTLSRLESGKRR
ncbi:hypothetical protein ACVBEQ_00385 [Nakamurella sp. GG22]